MDVRHCYQNLTRRAVMRRLRRDVHKNHVLLWFVDELLSTFQHGFSIGSFLSQFLCNYMLSYAYHFATEQLYKIRKRRTGKRRGCASWALFCSTWTIFYSSARRSKTSRKPPSVLPAYLLRRARPRNKTYMARQGPRKRTYRHYGLCHSTRPHNRAGAYFCTRTAAILAGVGVFRGGRLYHDQGSRRIISYRGYFSHTDSVEISAKLHVVEVSRAASNVISAAARAELAAAA